jgi:hypothetical protein
MMPTGSKEIYQKNKTVSFLFVICVFVLLFMFSFFLLGQQEFEVSDAPGDLSAVHQDSPGLASCDKCHNEELEVPVEKCLACHTEVADRISEGKGYHRDKNEDCIMCHTEHQGADEPIVFLDPEDFDHEETGAVLLGAHAKVTDCFACHRKDNTIPRKKNRSYIFLESGCQTCHSPPHPGQQEKCLACHTQNSWEVDIWVPGDLS